MNINLKTKEGFDTMELKDFLLPENVELGSCFNTWQECITRAGELLESNGYISEAYIRDMLHMVQSMGPYIVIMPGVALAHARPKGNVNRNGISLVTIKGGVCFGNEENDPVYAVFAVAARTDAEHLILFKSLGKFLSVEENVEILKNAEHFENIKLW